MSRKAFEKMMAVVECAIAIAEGRADPATYRIHVPAEIDTRAIRADLGLSRPLFARRFRIPLGTLRDREQGRKMPDAPARALIQVIRLEPKAAERALKKATG